MNLNLKLVKDSRLYRKMYRKIGLYTRYKGTTIDIMENYVTLTLEESNGKKLSIIIVIFWSDLPK